MYHDIQSAGGIGKAITVPGNLQGRRTVDVNRVLSGQKSKDEKPPDLRNVYILNRPNNIGVGAPVSLGDSPDWTGAFAGAAVEGNELEEIGRVLVEAFEGISKIEGSIRWVGDRVSESQEVQATMGYYASRLSEISKSLEGTVTGVERLLRLYGQRGSDEGNYVVAGRGFGGVSMEPADVVARIRFKNRIHRIRGRDILERSGGYVRYDDDVFGVFLRRQLRKLSWRFVRYQLVEEWPLAKSRRVGSRQYCI